jgi:hypothetical protein
VKRRPSCVESAALRLEDEPKYRVLLYQRGTRDQFEGSKTEVQVFFGTCLGSELAATEAIAEADEKALAMRKIEYALGHTARAVILRVMP